jgi:hypothetical protein
MVEKGVLMPDTQYVSLRQYLDPSIATLPDPSLKRVLRSANIDADMAEGFFDDFGKAVSSVGRAVAQAAPSIGRVAAQMAPSVLPIAGTVLGTAFGGPIGASLGGTLGSLAGKAIGSATGQGAPAGGPAAGIGGALGGIVGGLTGSPAAGQLLQTLFKPQTAQALTSMALGPLGRSSIPVGGTQVPITAFTNLLSSLVGRAEAEYNASVASNQSNVPAYMRDYAGQPKYDPAVAQHRAEALYELLEATEASEAAESAEAAEAAEAYESGESEMEAIQAEYDAIEMAELYEYEAEEA